MTAVAPPLTLQPGSRLGWNSNNNNEGAFASATSSDAGIMFPTTGPRNSLQRQNSGSSTHSNSSTSSSSTVVVGSMPQYGSSDTNFQANGDNRIYPGHKKRPTRWPPGKAEPATGISTARPQAVNSMTSGPSASSAISALHAPMVAGQRTENGAVQSNGLSGAAGGEPNAILHLLPMNGTFERKTIQVPYFPDVLRIGRQTNQKTIPTPLNGYFDSKVLSRQHAEVWADRNGRIFIRDVKSSNGTFVNGMRLSQENKESEPRELREQDVLELGIDIVSEDQKTVVHHKVAAKVEHAGVYGPAQDVINFGDLDPGVGGGIFMPVAPQLKRNGSHGSISSNRVMNMATGHAGPVPPQAQSNQPAHMRAWLNPLSPDTVMKRINAEMKLAIQQSEDLARARQTIEAMLSGKFDSSQKERPGGSERLRSSPNKSKTDLKSHFTEPPAPPPSAPLPEKPDVARALADPVIQPILRRNDTVLPNSATNSPTRIDHSSDILRLCEELKLAKGELSDQSEKMKVLENELAQERTARETAEERAQHLEKSERKDSPRDSYDGAAAKSSSSADDDDNAHKQAFSFNDDSSDLQAQLDRLHATMDEMKQQMELFRSRAESAEAERDEVRQSLAEMVEQKRRQNAAETAADGDATTATAADKTASHSSKTKKSSKSDSSRNISGGALANGHILPSSPPSSPTTSEVLLEKAGVEEGQPITPEQAKLLTQFLTQEVLQDYHHGSSSNSAGIMEQGSSRTAYYGIPITSAAAVILLGVVLMNWGNGWPKIDR